MKLAASPRSASVLLALVVLILGPDLLAQSDRRDRRWNEPVILWDQTFEATHEERWIEAPATGWPTDNGRLVVRVARSQGVSSCHQLVAGRDRSVTEPRDYTLDTDVMAKAAKKAGSAPAWAWWGQGQGRVHIQVIWFPAKHDAKAYLAERPYDSHFAPTVHAPAAEPMPPPPGQHDPYSTSVRILFDQTLIANDHPQWMVGPERSWDPSQGALLLRVAGEPHVRELRWRVGQSSRHQELRAGDHVLDPNVLERGTPRNPFEVILGAPPTHEPFNFALVGRGSARVQLLWIPSREHAQSYCAANPIGFGAPPLPGEPGQPVPPGPPALPGQPGPPTLPPQPQQPPSAPIGVPVDPRGAPGYVTITFAGRLTDASNGTPIPELDVAVQLANTPRTIYGGGRTDADGRFIFSVNLPAATPVVLRIPERRTESDPRTFNSQAERWDWSVSLR